MMLIIAIMIAMSMRNLMPESFLWCRGLDVGDDYYDHNDSNDRDNEFMPESFIVMLQDFTMLMVMMSMITMMNLMEKTSC